MEKVGRVQADAFENSTLLEGLTSLGRCVCLPVVGSYDDKVARLRVASPGVRRCREARPEEGAGHERRSPRVSRHRRRHARQEET